MLKHWRLAWISGFPPVGWLTIQYEYELVGDEIERFRALHEPSDGIGRRSTHVYPVIGSQIAEAVAAELQRLATNETWTRSETGNQWGAWREMDTCPEWAAGWKMDIEEREARSKARVRR